jgi:phosphoglucosamine mutase
LVTGLQVLAAIVEAGRATSDVCRVFEPLPQVAQSVGFNGSSPLQDVSVRKAIAAAEDRLRGMGRLLVRKSGTEPMIRIMAEGEDQKLVGDVVNDIAETLRAAA